MTETEAKIEQVSQFLVSDDNLKRAVELKTANCYGALSFANYLGGRPDTPWLICHTHPLKAILEECQKRNLDLSGLKSAVDGIPVTETMYYRRAAGVITEDEFQDEFRSWQSGKKKVG